MDEFKVILDAMIETLPKETSSFGNPIELKELYIPPAHKKALRLYSNLIVGDRGVGKSTWTAALADPKKRKAIENMPELENAAVTVGFSEKPNPEKHPDKDTINNLLEENINPHDMWKAVVIRWLSHEINVPIPINKWQESIFWVKNNPEECSKILSTANGSFKDNNSNGMILFDALDVSSDTWEIMDKIVRELLRLVLELKAYSNIHAKVFLREDQFSRTITNFPDASKLLPNKTELTWERYDLHGLLWQQLCNAMGKGGDILRNYHKEVAGAAPEFKNEYWIIADNIKKEEEMQKKLFEKLAGPWMGKDKKRGVPYIWTVGHLADGNDHTSPRSFLLAIKTAAEDSLNKTGNYPLHYESIKKGVQIASKNRVAEIAEDYPWINNLCNLLNGKNVPISFVDIEREWIKEYPGGPITIKTEKLPPQDSERGWLGIKKELVRLGIFEEMRDERINMPDLFRVGFGLGRKGGVTPIV
jgi:hypothetical protein